MVPLAAPVAVAAAAMGAAGAVAVRNPFRSGAWPGCPFHALTGWYCPFCGSTRAAYALLHGHPGLMAANNALLPLWVLLAAAGWMWWLARLELIPARIGRLAGARVLRPVLLAAVAGFWLARNLPGVAILAPHSHL